MNRLLQRSVTVVALFSALTAAHAASVCPFDTGGSDALNDGVVLTRYALGITGAPLTANTRYASLDPLQVKANIECVGCALDINGDGMVDTLDTTIIARHLSGFTGASLTAGLALGTTATTASVVSFLANGCAVGGAINAFVHGGNTFALGAGVASVLGNNDNRSLTFKAPKSTIKLLVDPANGDDGLRITYGGFGPTASPNTINGSRDNSVAAGVQGATIAGGGYPYYGSQVTANYGTVGGGFYNVAGDTAVVAGGYGNRATGLSTSIGGGGTNVASGDFGTVPGGGSNSAVGSFSFAAGNSANANHDGAFVWADGSAVGAASTGINQFVIRAKGGIRLPGAGENQPGNAAKQSGTNMFTHVVPTSGACGTTVSTTFRTALDHPLTNGKADAILVVMPNFGSNIDGGTPVFGNPVAVYYEATGAGGCPQNRWVIYAISQAGTMLPGQKFNVFVINP